MPERVLLSRSGIQVTDARFIAGSNSYPLRGITAVRVASTRKVDSLDGVLLLFGTGATLFVSVLLVVVALAPSEGEFFSNRLIALVCAAALCVVGLYMWRIYKKWLKSLTYVLCLSTASGEVHAMTSSDQLLVNEIAETVNNALVNL
jgi:hypothetical protein